MEDLKEAAALPEVLDGDEADISDKGFSNQFLL
jgi:hypothetical protein